MVTVAFGRVPRTSARHDGQVYGLVVRRDRAAEVACHENHSFKQDPQKVCRQSSRVKGWYMTSVQICRGNLGQHEASGWRRCIVSHTEHVNSFSSTRLPLLLVPSAMMACASVGRSSCWAATNISLPLSLKEQRGAASVTKALVAQPCSRALARSCHGRAQLRTVRSIY